MIRRSAILFFFFLFVCAVFVTLLIDRLSATVQVSVESPMRVGEFVLPAGRESYHRAHDDSATNHHRHRRCSRQLTVEVDIIILRVGTLDRSLGRIQSQYQFPRSRRVLDGFAAAECMRQSETLRSASPNNIRRISLQTFLARVLHGVHRERPVIEGRRAATVPLIYYRNLL